jgi:hypothetical protein
MRTHQARLPLRSEQKTLLAKTHQADNANLQLAHEVLADTENPKYAHLLVWAERVVSRPGAEAER